MSYAYLRSCWTFADVFVLAVTLLTVFRDFEPLEVDCSAADIRKHILTRNHVFRAILRPNPLRFVVCRWLDGTRRRLRKKVEKKQRICNYILHHMGSCSRESNPHQIRQSSMSNRRYHSYTIWYGWIQKFRRWRSVKVGLSMETITRPHDMQPCRAYRWLGRQNRFAHANDLWTSVHWLSTLLNNKIKKLSSF